MFDQAVHVPFKISLFPLFAVSFITFLAIQLLSAAPAHANCTYGGRTYKTGETRGPYICMPNGTWQRR